MLNIDIDIYDIFTKSRNVRLGILSVELLINTGNLMTFPFDSRESRGQTGNYINPLGGSMPKGHGARLECAGQIRVLEREPMLSTPMESSILMKDYHASVDTPKESEGKREGKALILNPFVSASADD
ncbi:unnamed protein product [Lasius platythorax]|uniref:Uncharacterized protein n=1 Tax=Lasius platythorax TaxID=488582 RepID=A0AAV2P4A6_9HYME